VESKSKSGQLTVPCKADKSASFRLYASIAWRTTSSQEVRLVNLSIDGGCGKPPRMRFA
jgi:hypothetical protein